MLLSIFIVGYAFIAMEDVVKVNKSGTALFTAALCWFALVAGSSSFFPEMQQGEEVFHFLSESLGHHLGEIAQILFFLLGAMTIVEVIDANGGFAIITNAIRTTSTTRLLWVLSVITFFLSAVLDNLTTAIVMATMVRKLVADRELSLLYAGMVVIAANSGGAWSPIGDVTTIMLWIGGQVTAPVLVSELFIPSLICMLVPLVLLTYQLRGSSLGSVAASETNNATHHAILPTPQRNLIFFAGIGFLLLVPILKSITHLPPFMGVMFGLGSLWIITEVMIKRNGNEEQGRLRVVDIIRRVDTPSILFFLGILLAVGALQTSGHLRDAAMSLSSTVTDPYLLNGLIGLLSAIVDNVPLVAATMSMFPLEQIPQNDLFWKLLAYCAGTGGSVLIIGSAAGITLMGILHVSFLDYLKKISWLALLGFIAGLATYYLMQQI